MRRLIAWRRKRGDGHGGGGSCGDDSRAESGGYGDGEEWFEGEEGGSCGLSCSVNAFIVWTLKVKNLVTTGGYFGRKKPVRPGKNKRKKGRKLDSGNQVRQRFRESFQEERAAIRGIVPKEKEGEQQYWELFPKEGRPIDSGNQSKKTAYRERQIQKREKDNRKRFRESFQEDRRQRFRESFQKKKQTIQGIVPRRRYKRFRVFVSRKGATRVCPNCV
ncbi:hypothetical protein Tco_0011116 [Tanacetum coccineum]